MSKVVAHLMKFKADNLGGVLRHVERVTDNHKNLDINPELSHLNYDLIDNPLNQKQIIHVINQTKSSQKSVRKDAVLVGGWIVSAEKEFFNNILNEPYSTAIDLSPPSEEEKQEEIKRFFQVAVNYFSEKFGRENIAYAKVHLDETTPHLHIGVIPFTADKKLSAKLVFNKKTLTEVQEELPKKLKENDFYIERGIKGSNATHINPEEYKALEEYKRETVQSYRYLEKEITYLTEDRETLIKELEIIKKNAVNIYPEIEFNPEYKASFFGKKETGNVIISEENFNKLMNKYKYADGLIEVYKELKQNNKYLKSKIEQLTKENKELEIEKKKNTSLYLENMTLENKLDRTKECLNDYERAIYDILNLYIPKNTNIGVHLARKIHSQLSPKSIVYERNKINSLVLNIEHALGNTFKHLKKSVYDDFTQEMLNLKTFEELQEERYKEINQYQPYHHNNEFERGF